MQRVKGIVIIRESFELSEILVSIFWTFKSLRKVKNGKWPRIVGNVRVLYRKGLDSGMISRTVRTG